ncbi:MAG: flavodoxin family protein [Lachnospiraceae bacterium]|nr:flavodoxin family protein [Lachnospiraceae bacterium]
MKVILHDLKGNMTDILEEKADKVIFADGKYAPCQGCFKCWTKHPATCAMTDSLHEICRVLGQADEFTIITENCYGGYSPDVKRVLDRGIGISTPMSTYRGGMMHHTLRYGKHEILQVFVYGDITEKEKETWKLMVKANSLNDGYSSYAVSFVSESELKEGAVL